MEIGVFIKNIVIISAVLGVVFLSQQPYFRGISKNYVYSGVKNGDTYLKKASNWFHNNIYPRTSGEVVLNNNPIDLVKKEIDKQKNNIEKNSVDGIKKYVAEKLLNILGIKPEDLIQCKPAN